jgi:hypothetical protein
MVRGVEQTEIGTGLIYLKLAGPCFIIQHVSDASTPINRSIQLQYQPLILPLERGGSSVVGRGLAGYNF